MAARRINNPSFVFVPDRFPSRKIITSGKNTLNAYAVMRASLPLNQPANALAKRTMATMTAASSKVIRSQVRSENKLSHSPRLSIFLMPLRVSSRFLKKRMTG